MIIYNPLDGDALTSTIPSRPRHCFLMTQLGGQVPDGVQAIREAVNRLCLSVNYQLIDARAIVTGRDLLMNIWTLIASTPLSVGVCHEEIPRNTQMNIYYELGVAQALGKETLLVKSLHSEVPSDLVRTQYVKYDNDFDANFTTYLTSLQEQGEHYAIVADQLDRDPVLALDYLKRAFLISGDESLRATARNVRNTAGLDDRARNSVELLAANF